MKTCTKSVPHLPPVVDRAVTQNLWTKQLSLLVDQAIDQAESGECQTSIEPVPDDVRLGSQPRFYFTVRQYDLHWRYPLQFHQDEIRLLLPHLQKLNCELDPDEGCPIEIRFIHEQVEYLIDSALPTLQQMAAHGRAAA